MRKKEANGIEEKKKKKEAYQPISGALGEATDYHVYAMTFWDRLLAMALGFAASILVIRIFFGSVLVGAVGGIFLCSPAQKFYREYRIKKRQQNLLLQFKDLLESLASSYSAGQNTVGAFSDARSDMVSIYGEESDIVAEVDQIVTGMQNNVTIEVLLNNFAARSGLDDVESFANVFEVSNRQGSNLNKVISESREIINDKIEIEMEIDTMLQGNKNELNIMALSPLVVVPFLGGLGGETTITGNSLTNVVVKIVCICIFAGAYLMGRKMVNVKV